MNRKILNWTMFLSMIVVYASGFLIKLNKVFIAVHVLASVVLIVCVSVHMVKNRMFKARKSRKRD